MIQLIKKRITQKRESLIVMRSYLEDKIKNDQYSAIDRASAEIQLILASISELEWMLSIIQQMGKTK